MKFIHTADWQIGMKAAHVGAVGQRVRSARLDAANRVVEVANAENAEFIIVAGDTFEDNAVDRILVQKVADILSRFSNDVYLISGNHDPLVPGSVWDHAAWQSHGNLHVLKQRQPLEIESATIYPCPLFEKHSLKDPTRWIDAQANKKISIGVGHGTVEGIVQSEIDYPIARDAACKAGLDYLGIGHWHSFATFPSADGAVRMAYSGTHETTKFGERDSGNAVLVEIVARGAHPKLTPIPTGELKWLQIKESFADPEDALHLRERIEMIPDVEKSLLDLKIEGVLLQEYQAELVRIDEIVNARFLYHRTDRSRLLPGPKDDQWMESLPIGIIRDVARRLQELGDPASHIGRPEYATKDVATRALIELFQMDLEERS